MPILAEFRQALPWSWPASPQVESLAGVWLVGLVYLLLFAGGLVADGALAWHWVHHPVSWRPRIARLQARPWTAREAGVLLLILVGLQAAALALYHSAESLGVLPKLDPEIAGALLQGLAFHGAGLALVLDTIKRRGWSWNCALGLPPRRWWVPVGQALVFYLALLPLVCATALVYQLILVWLQYPLTVQNVALIFLRPQPLGIQAVLIVLAFGLAPLVEEILFRGIGLALVTRWFGVGWAIVLTSALFAGIHWHVPSFAPLFVLAAGFAIAYIYTGSIVVPVVMHAVFNGMNVAVLLFLGMN